LPSILDIDYREESVQRNYSSYWAKQLPSSVSK